MECKPSDEIASPGRTWDARMRRRRHRRARGRRGLNRIATIFEYAGLSGQCGVAVWMKSRAIRGGEKGRLHTQRFSCSAVLC